MSPDTYTALFGKLEALETLWSVLSDRVAILEEVTCNHESRLEDVEDWQEKVEDHLDDIDKEL